MPAGDRAARARMARQKIGGGPEAGIEPRDLYGMPDAPYPQRNGVVPPPAPGESPQEKAWADLQANPPVSRGAIGDGRSGPTGLVEDQRAAGEPSGFVQDQRARPGAPPTPNMFGKAPTNDDIIAYENTKRAELGMAPMGDPRASQAGGGKIKERARRTGEEPSDTIAGEGGLAIGAGKLKERRQPFRPTEGNSFVDAYDDAFGEGTVKGGGHQMQSFTRDVPQQSSKPAASMSGGGAGQPAGPSTDEQVKSGFGPYAEGYGNIQAGQAGETHMLAQNEGDRGKQILDAATAQVGIEAASKAADLDRQQKSQAAFDSAQKASDDAAQAKMDPSRFYNSLDTGGKVAAGIAVALGAIGQVYGSNENIGAKLITQAIDRDLASQAKNIDTLHQNAGAKLSLAQDLRKKFGDDKAAEMVHKQAMLTNALMQIDGKMQMANSPVILARGQKVMGALQLEVAKTQEAIRAHAEALAAAKQAGGVAAALSPKQMDADTKFLANFEKDSNAPATEAAAKGAQDAMDKSGGAGVGSFGNRLFSSEAVGGLGKEAHALIYGKDAAEGQRAYQSFTNNAMKAMSGSGVSGTEQARLMNQLNGANTVEARRSAIREVLQSTADARAAARAGVDPQAVKVYEARKSLYQRPSSVKNED